MQITMWCPLCQSEVPADLLTCPACGNVPEERLSAPARESVSASLDTGVCGFEDEASCRGAVAIVEAAGITAQMVPQPAEDSPETLEYWLAVRAVDAERAGELLAPHLATRCSLCAELLGENDTVCASCGEPRA